MTFHFDLDRDCVLTVRACANVMKKNMVDTAFTSVAVPITKPGLSMREFALNMKKQRMFNALCELESEIQSFCDIRVSVSHTCFKLTHTPNTLLGNIDNE